MVGTLYADLHFFANICQQLLTVPLHKGWRSILVVDCIAMRNFVVVWKPQNVITLAISDTLIWFAMSIIL